MADCELISKCIFFNEKMNGMPSTSDLLKKQYCLADNSECARYVVFKALGREKVPADLFPHNTERAKAIVAGK
jgi:hypothetical protein